MNVNADRSYACVVRLFLVGGLLILGKYWIEPLGAKHTLTQNISRTKPARLLAVFIVRTGARLITYDK